MYWLVIRLSHQKLTVCEHDSELDPPIGRSVYECGPSAWRIGSVVCEKVSEVPKHALAHWQDHDTNTFCLRRADSTQMDMKDARPIYNSGSSGAVWEIGGVICKVKSWEKGIELENETIDFVTKRVNGIPLPKVVFAWTEPDCSRSYLLLQKLPGITLQSAWPSRNPAQRIKIAAQTAEYCEMLAMVTSSSLQTATGCGIIDNFLMTRPHEDEPSWKRKILGPMDLVHAKNYLSPLPADVFHYYHSDLGPTNILILDGQVSGIIDWEHAAYYPRFWIATKPRVSYGFALEGDDMWAWVKLFSQALEERDFEDSSSDYIRWRKVLWKEGPS